MNAYSPCARHYATVGTQTWMPSRCALCEAGWIANEGQTIHVINEHTISFTAKGCQH